MKNNLMQFKFINQAISYLNIRTGDRNIDLFITSIFQAIIFSYVSYIIAQFSFMPKKLQAYGRVYIQQIKLIISSIWYYIYNKPKIFEKKVDIMYITDTKQINELYKAVYWYISNTNDVDYINEQYLQYTCDQKSLMSDSCEINKIIIY